MNHIYSRCEAFRVLTGRMRPGSASSFIEKALVGVPGWTRAPPWVRGNWPEPLPSGQRLLWLRHQDPIVDFCA